MQSPRFRLDEDMDIVDTDKIKVYSFKSSKDWEKLCILLNSLVLQWQKSEKMYNDLVETIQEEYSEYNDYIDEYSMIKVDVIDDLASKLRIDLE